MSQQFNLLGISGSLRKSATNRRLIAEAIRLFDPATTNIADIDLPLYDGDEEETNGIPEMVQRLADQIANADAVIISTPEYNAALSEVLKNALDWVSRTNGNPWHNKPTAIMSAAAGRAGGARALSSLRLCMPRFTPTLSQALKFCLPPRVAPLMKAVTSQTHALNRVCRT